jgi:peroxin-3
MFVGTRRWFRRNRTPLAIGLGVIGTGYVVTQYVLAKINDARERMSQDRIAKEKYVLPLSSLYKALVADKMS